LVSPPVLGPSNHLTTPSRHQNNDGHDKPAFGSIPHNHLDLSVGIKSLLRAYSEAETLADWSVLERAERKAIRHILSKLTSADMTDQQDLEFLRGRERLCWDSTILRARCGSAMYPVVRHDWKNKKCEMAQWYSFGRATTGPDFEPPS